MLAPAVITTKENSSSFLCLQSAILYIKIANITIRRKPLLVWQSI